jgi:hypothetical protein
MKVKRKKLVRMENPLDKKRTRDLPNMVRIYQATPYVTGISRITEHTAEVHRGTNKQTEGERRRRHDVRGVLKTYT